jgi:peptide-methionine (S)-S-oxide reductase
MENTTNNKTATATFGNGCFWCTEAIFQNLKGVISAVSGYSGGKTENPSYEEVCTGTTGHAEVLQVVFDPEVISYGDLLKAFFASHDPTTLNKQGGDVGTQYRSVIYYHDDTQKDVAENEKHALDHSGLLKSSVVTEIAPFTKFYPAEDYHQNYFNLHGHAPYCAMVIKPKVEKFQKSFQEKLRQ